jgi:hypothetical protein
MKRLLKQQKKQPARNQRLMPVILAAWKAELGKDWGSAISL